jgi:hypothetical protein
LRWLSIWADSCGPFGRVTSCRNAAGFEFDPESKKHRVSMWKGHYTKCQLPYTPLAQGKGLRPGVRIETSGLAALRREAVEESVISFLTRLRGDLRFNPI